MLLKDRLQSITEAVAKMTAEKSKEITEKWLALEIYFLFKFKKVKFNFDETSKRYRKRIQLYCI